MVEYLGFILFGEDQDTFVKRFLICIGQYKGGCNLNCVSKANKKSINFANTVFL